MTLPILFFAILISMLCGVLFHLLRGGGGWRLLYYIGVSSLGFAAGQFIHFWRDWSLVEFGALDIGMGVIGSTLFLVFGEWLSRIEVNKQNGV